MNRKEWLICAGMLSAYYPTSFRADNEVAIEAWFRALKDLPGPIVEAAILHLTKTKPSFPSVADVRRLAEIQPDAAAAWGEVLEQVARVGHYPEFRNGQRIAAEPTFTNPATHDAIRALGGWEHVCKNMTTADGTTWSAQFRRAFDASTEARSRNATFTALGVKPVGHQLAAQETKQLQAGRETE